MKIIPLPPSQKQAVGLSDANDWSRPIPAMAAVERDVIRDDDLRQAYQRLAAVKPPPTGCVVVRDATVVGGSGVVVDRRNGVTCSAWQELGWTGAQLRIAIEHLGGAYDPNEFDIPDARLQPDEILDEAILLAWPGVNTFGHWIVDVPARLGVAERCGHGAIRTAIVGQPHCMPWQQALLSRLGRHDLRLTSADRRAVGVKRLVVPSLIRNNDYLGRVLYRDIFPQPGPRPAAPKPVPLALIRHTPITSQRPRVANLAEVEADVLARGGVAIDPLTMPLSELLRLLAAAEVVVGEDSSALHNAAQLADGPDLIVLAAARTNLLHAGLQSLRARAVAYVHAAPERHDVALGHIAAALTRVHAWRRESAGRLSA